jgi:hypothetical protein
MSRLRAITGSRSFKLLLSAGLLALLFYETDLREMRAALAAARVGWLALAVATFVLSQVMSAFRWTLLVRPVGFTQPFTRICLYYFSGMYLNLFGPGTVAGDLGRVLMLAGGQRRALALTTVLAHRAIGFVALVWIGAVAIVLLPDQPLPGVFRWLAALAIPATFAGWVWGPRLVARLLPRTNNWRVLVERDLAPYWHDRRLLSVSLAWSVAVQSLQLGGQMLVARARATVGVLSRGGAARHRRRDDAVQSAGGGRPGGGLLVLPLADRRAARGGAGGRTADQHGHPHQRAHRVAGLPDAAAEAAIGGHRVGGGARARQLLNALRRMIVSCRRAPTETMKIGVAVSSSSAVR